MSALEQRRAAAQRSAIVRVDRARLKASVEQGAVSLARAMAEPCCAAMTVYDLLVCQHGFGRYRVLTALRVAAVKLGAPVPEMKFVGGLTERQKQALVDACASIRERTTA